MDQNDYEPYPGNLSMKACAIEEPLTNCPKISEEKLISLQRDFRDIVELSGCEGTEKNVQFRCALLESKLKELESKKK